jgi:hypothetical protein
MPLQNLDGAEKSTVSASSFFVLILCKGHKRYSQAGRPAAVPADPAACSSCERCRAHAASGPRAPVLGAGMTIRMLTPACAESKRLIDWVETGARPRSFCCPVGNVADLPSAGTAQAAP